jgi:LysR family hydrogen peroxide-inducible transcriptional activator
MKFESGNFETLIRLVDRGMGATMLPALVAEELPAKKRREQLRGMSAPVPVREIGLVTARTDLRKRVTDALFEVVGERLRKAPGQAPRKARVLDPLA